MFFLTPVSALGYTYPTCPAYSHESGNDEAVHRAAYDYALAHARVEALRQRDQERRYQEAVRREQARRRAEVVELVESIYEQQYPQYVQHAFGFPSFDAERYRRRLEVEAARRRAEVLRQRQEAERARGETACCETSASIQGRLVLTLRPLAALQVPLWTPFSRYVLRSNNIHHLHRTLHPSLQGVHPWSRGILDGCQPKRSKLHRKAALTEVYCSAARSVMIFRK